MSKPEKKLSVQQIIDIRVLHNSGVSQVQLSKEYGVSRATIQNMLRGFYVRKPKPGVEETESFQEQWSRRAKETYERLSSKYAVPR